MKVNRIYPKNCSYNNWLDKEVLSSKKVFDGATCDLEKLEKSGEDKLPFSLDKDNRGLIIKYNCKIDEFTRRPGIGVKINFEKGDYSEYNRVRINFRANVIGIQNIYMHFSLQDGDKYFTHAPCAKTNEWNPIIFEVNNFNKKDLSFIRFTPFIGGCPPYSDGNFELIIKDIIFEKVEAEDELGYGLSSRIAYSHLGYYSNAKKTFIVSEWDKNFKIIKDNEIVYEGKTKKEESTIGVFGVGDFSSITEKGKYQIEINGKTTEKFEISDDPYKEGMEKGVYFLYQLRCGVDIPGVHEPCHLYSFTTNEKGDKVPNFGGWHDAGDLSQFEICTALMTSSLLELYQSNKNKKVLEEAKVGLNWLLQTTFHNGERALAILYDKWYDNVKLANGHYPDNRAENGPFENMLASAALSLGALVFKKIDAAFSAWCLNIAKEDYKFGLDGYKEGKYSKRWGPSVIPQVLGASLTAARYLYQLTNDEKYIADAAENAKLVMACQEKEYVGENFKVRGFFYEDLEHKYLLTYEHRGHESSPVCGLVDLCNAFPNHPDYNEWLESINLYKEYIENTIHLTAPYSFLPGHIYHPDKVNYDRITIPASFGPREEKILELKEQIRNGYSMGNSWYIRRMPIAIQRRGFHATLLSKTKGVSSIAKLLKDEELKQIVLDQLEWIVGKNPFATSTIYGVGYNYHPLYVAYSNQLIGAMPVGFETFGVSDEPFWPVKCNSVYKEIWGHTAGYYLGILADLKW